MHPYILYTPSSCTLGRGGLLESTGHLYTCWRTTYLNIVDKKAHLLFDMRRAEKKHCISIAALCFLLSCSPHAQKTFSGALLANGPWPFATHWNSNNTAATGTANCPSLRKLSFFNVLCLLSAWWAALQAEFIAVATSVGEERDYIYSVLSDWMPACKGWE